MLFELARIIIQRHMKRHPELRYVITADNAYFAKRDARKEAKGIQKSKHIEYSNGKSYVLATPQPVVLPERNCEI